MKTTTTKKINVTIFLLNLIARITLKFTKDLLMRNNNRVRRLLLASRSEAKEFQSSNYPISKQNLHLYNRVQNHELCKILATRYNREQEIIILI